LNKLIVTLLRWLVVLAMPVLLVLTAGRIMVADWYPRYEYAKPDFPADPYGFTQAQRLELATVCIHYLQRPGPPEAAISMLQELRLPGSDSLSGDGDKPLFAEYEISHMLDVKRFTDVLWRAHAVAALLAIGSLVLLLARRSTRRDGYAALLGGGLLTAGLLAFLGLFVLLGWRTFFIGFHEIFFPPGTWTFDWSDSLIRLFPDKFWFDAGAILTIGTLASGGLVSLAGRRLGR
jgi:integral membrane protein (TIGR01906 family)